MQLKRKERKPKSCFKGAGSVLLWGARHLSLGGSFCLVLLVFCLACFPLIISWWVLFPSSELLALPALGGSLQQQELTVLLASRGDRAGQQAALSPRIQRLPLSQKERPLSWPGVPDSAFRPEPAPLGVTQFSLLQNTPNISNTPGAEGVEAGCVCTEQTDPAPLKLENESQNTTTSTFKSMCT